MAITWHEFLVIFLEKFVPQTRREELRRDFEKLHQGAMLLVREAETDARFDQVVEIARCLKQVCGLESKEWDGKMPCGLGGLSGTSTGGQSHYTRDRPYRPAQMAHQVPQSFLVQGCYDCGELGHVRKYSPHYYRGLVQQGGHIITPTPVATPPAEPAWGGGNAGRGLPREGGQAGGGQARFYAFPAILEEIASDAVITRIFLVCHRDASVLFDPGYTYSYVSSYFSRYLDMPRDSLVMHIHVSTPVGDSIIADCVYQSCVVTIRGYETSVDLSLLSMVDFDMILGMD
ncbi:uncharacterized protein [Nicotiana tomentosiformis]|uniref:uncharacterized protein n=1 Tax=Nicotiana tomentosiformis TaxID=4098 RepID=UPI00388CE300